FFALLLVVIIITPSFALDPYKAAAAPPFSTVILSISSGLMLDKPSPPSAVTPPPLTPADAASLKLVLSTGTPLITINGLFVPLMDDCPRIRILEVLPGPVPSV